MSPWAVSVQTWIAALVTLAVLSYIFKDSFGYRVVQHAALGFGTAIVLVLTYRDALQTTWVMPIVDGAHALVGRSDAHAAPAMTSSDAAAPGTAPAASAPASATAATGNAPPAPLKEQPDRRRGLLWLLMLIPGVMWYFQMSRKLYWVSLPVTGLFVGVAAGLAFKVQLQTVMPQISASIKPLNPWALQPNPGSGAAWLTVLNNAFFVLVLLTSLLYFFFSIRMDRAAFRGPVRFGRLAIMLTLGAMFACTVITRTSYLLVCLQLVYTDWVVGQLYRPVAALFGAHG